MKMLVTVSVPAISAKYDILVPDTLRTKFAVSVIADAVEELSNHNYISSGEECLCLVERGVLLKHNITLRKQGVRNGDHLIMM